MQYLNNWFVLNSIFFKLWIFIARIEIQAVALLGFLKKPNCLQINYNSLNYPAIKDNCA